MTTTAVNPVEVDTRYLVALTERTYAAHEQTYSARSLLDTIKRAPQDVQEKHQVRGLYLGSFVDVPGLLDVAEQIAVECGNESLLARQIRFGAEQVSKVSEKRRAAQSVLNECDDLWRENGFWSRYYLVTSSSGLIHASMSCSTCNKGQRPTEFALLPSLSGLSVDKAVEVLGPALCSVCFPEAPTGWQEQVKINKALVEVLARRGEEAFQKAKAEYEAKQAKIAAETCPGSGKKVVEYKPGGYRSSGFGQCATCGSRVTTTSQYSDVARKHKKEQR